MNYWAEYQFEEINYVGLVFLLCCACFFPFFQLLSMTVHQYDKWLCKIVHDLCWFDLGILPSSSCVSIRIFNLTSQIYIEWCRLCCFMGYSEIASWCGFPPYWRPWGDFVDRRFLEKGFGINQIYFFFSMNLRNLHNTQEAGKWWAFWYEILIIFFFHSQIFP
jgi:hypothetical protein